MNIIVMFYRCIVKCHVSRPLYYIYPFACRVRVQLFQVRVDSTQSDVRLNLTTDG